jgi:hypothetical protein
VAVRGVTLEQVVLALETEQEMQGLAAAAVVAVDEERQQVTAVGAAAA